MPARPRRPGSSVRPRRADALRPTAGRVRDGLFNRLGGWVAGRTVLDLFAGTGTLGIEALQRGALRAVFVEQDPVRARTIRDRLRQCGLERDGVVRCEDAVGAPRRLARAGEVFDLVLMDPPYGGGWLARTLAAVVGAGVVAPDGVIVAEGHWRDRPALPPDLVVEREARYGETALWFIRTRTEARA